MPRHSSAALILLIAAVLHAQNAAKPDAAPPVFRANARDVVVDVVVTHDRGQPVDGMRSSDFVVLEDGKPQTIDFFEEHQGKALPAGSLPSLPQMPPNVFTNVPPAPQNDAVNILLFDMLNTDPQDQVYVRQQVLRYLLKSRPGTRIGIFALGAQLRFVQGFTTDTSVLQAAMQKLIPARQSLAQTRNDAADETEELAVMKALAGLTESKGGGGGAAGPTTMGNAGTGTSGITALTAAMGTVNEMNQADRMAMTLEALQYLARYLGDVPGRKNLLWFSGSFPVILYPSAAQREQISLARGYVSQANDAANQLTASKVAVYPINAEGMMIDRSGDASNSMETAGRGADLGANLMGEASARADTIYAMEQIASDTGGKAFYNTNDLTAAVDKAVTDGSHYYTLVYSPTNKAMDGKYRHVEVKVPGQKVQLSYRRGYNASEVPENPGKTSSNPLQPLLMHGLPGATQILFAARVVPATPQPAASAPIAGRNAKLERPVRRYSVDLMIRWTDIKFDQARDGKRTGQIEVELLAYDRSGHAVNWTGGTQSMSVDPQLFASIQKSGVPAHLEIDLPANQEVFLDAGVYDWGTGRAGTLEVPIAATGTAQAQSGH